MDRSAFPEPTREMNPRDITAELEYLGEVRDAQPDGTPCTCECDSCTDSYGCGGFECECECDGCEGDGCSGHSCDCDDCQRESCDGCSGSHCPGCTGEHHGEIEAVSLGCTDGCELETTDPGETCDHGHPTWLRRLALA
jgi:hypothetical protein